MKSIFHNYQGLNNHASNGFLLVNLDEEGRFVSDPTQEEIPEIVIDSNGEYSLSSFNQEPFIKQIIQKDAVINDLYSQLSAYEKAISKISTNKNVLKLLAKFNQGRADVSEGELAKSFTTINSIHRGYSDITNELSVKAQSLYINEKEKDVVDDMNDRIISEMGNVLGKPATENARQDWIRMANNLLDIQQGAKVNVVVPQQAPTKQSDDSSLTEKFQKVKVSG